MKCEDVRRQCQLLLDDELGDEARELLQSHLEDCPHCKKRVRVEVRFKTTIVEKFSVRSAPSDLLERIKSRLF